ncbi:hypothetical protein B0I37DRAFT_353760 [Chaetomium sp. MPI-CAGE-AT-0009]|nr:hypothetical protein B0I37DRAFT_353760 [Chaetomium sp. MPI-CAGE-AT-0009]
MPMRIHMQGKDTDNLDPDALGAVYRMIRLALDILAHERSVEKMVYIGAHSVQSWGDRKHPKQIIYPTTPSSDEKSRYKKPSDREMGRWVAVFLGKIRHCFPRIDIRELDEGTHAMFGRLDSWVEDARQSCFDAHQEPTQENVMLHWHALDSGLMRLDINSIKAIAQTRSWYLDAEKAGDKDAAKRYRIDHRAILVEGAFSVAHELVHCFIGFLSGTRAAATPLSLVPKGWEDENTPYRGESGRKWEELALGGCVSLSLPSKKGDRVKIKVKKQDEKRYEVDPNTIKDIVNGKIVLPLKTI